MTLRSTFTAAIRKLNPMRVGRVERLRRETAVKTEEALRKILRDRTMRLQEAHDKCDKLTEELLTERHSANVARNRLVALKALLIRLGNDDMGSTSPH